VYTGRGHEGEGMLARAVLARRKKCGAAVFSSLTFSLIVATI
jgi:hypothetical protein